MSDKKVDATRKQYLHDINRSYWRNVLLLGIMSGVFGALVLVFGIFRNSLWTPLFILAGGFFVGLFIILFASYLKYHNRELEDVRETTKTEAEQETEKLPEKQESQKPEAQEQPLKRKRGRPRKIEVVVSVPSKKKRGRPKKIKAEKQPKPKIKHVKKKKQIKKKVESKNKKTRRVK